MPLQYGNNVRVEFYMPLEEYRKIEAARPIGMSKSAFYVENIKAQLGIV